MSVQRSVFTLIAEVIEDPPGTFTLVPSPPRVVPKGASFVGAQFAVLPLSAPVLPAPPGSFRPRLQGRNGGTDGDWVDVLGGEGPVVDAGGPLTQMIGGVDQRVRVEPFAEIRLTASIESGARPDFAGARFGAFVKTDYMTG